MTVKMVIVQYEYESVFEVCRTWEDGSCTVRLHTRSAVRVMTERKFMMDDPLTNTAWPSDLQDMYICFYRRLCAGRQQGKLPHSLLR